MKAKVIAFIHAKSTSDRLPGKNRKKLGDAPLFMHALRNAQAAKLVDEVVIDSNDEFILSTGKAAGATPLVRPEALASNATTGDGLAYWQASNYPDSEIVLQVIPTSPFIKPSSIDNAISMIEEKGVDSVVGGFSEVVYEWVNKRPSYIPASGIIPNSFEKSPIVYETTGLYVNKTATVLRTQKRINVDSCAMLLLSKIEAIDINNHADFELAEIIWRGLHAK